MKLAFKVISDRFILSSAFSQGRTGILVWYSKMHSITDNYANLEYYEPNIDVKYRFEHKDIKYSVKG